MLLTFMSFLNFLVILKPPSVVFIHFEVTVFDLRAAVIGIRVAVIHQVALGFAEATGTRRCNRATRCRGHDGVSAIVLVAGVKVVMQSFFLLPAI